MLKNEKKLVFINAAFFIIYIVNIVIYSNLINISSDLDTKNLNYHSNILIFSIIWFIENSIPPYLLYKNKVIAFIAGISVFQYYLYYLDIFKTIEPAYITIFFAIFLTVLNSIIYLRKIKSSSLKLQAE